MWLQLPVQSGQEPSSLVEAYADQQLLGPLLPVTAARLAAFAEALIRLSTSRDARTHKFVGSVHDLPTGVFPRLSAVSCAICCCEG